MSRLILFVALLASALAHAEERPVPEALRPYAGRVVYVDFWASWCAPCAQSFPWLNEVQSRNGSRLAVVGVNVDKSEADAQRFLKRHPAKFDIVRDPDGRLAEFYNIQGMPSSVILDPQGRVLHQHAGFREGDAATYEEHIRRALQASGASPGADR